MYFKNKYGGKKVCGRKFGQSIAILIKTEVMCQFAKFIQKYQNVSNSLWIDFELKIQAIRILIEHFTYFFGFSSVFFIKNSQWKGIYAKISGLGLKMRNSIYPLLSKHVLHFQRKQGLYSQVLHFISLQDKGEHLLPHSYWELKQL